MLLKELLTGMSLNVHGACLASPSGLVSWWAWYDTAYDLRGAQVLPLDAVVGLEVRDETVEDWFPKAATSQYPKKTFASRSVVTK